MSVTNQNQEIDTLKVDYNEETHEIKLEWDKNDPKWNWLGLLTEQEASDMIIEILQNKLKENESN